MEVMMFFVDTLSASIFHLVPLKKGKCKNICTENSILGFQMHIKLSVLKPF